MIEVSSRLFKLPIKSIACSAHTQPKDTAGAPRKLCADVCAVSTLYNSMKIVSNTPILWLNIMVCCSSPSVVNYDSSVRCNLPGAVFYDSRSTFWCGATHQVLQIIILIRIMVCCKLPSALNYDSKSISWCAASRQVL